MLGATSLLQTMLIILLLSHSQLLTVLLSTFQLERSMTLLRGNNKETLQLGIELFQIVYNYENVVLNWLTQLNGY